MSSVRCLTGSITPSLMGNLNTVRFETALVYLSTNHRGSGDFCSALAYYRRTLAPSPGPMVPSAGDIEAGSVHLQ